MEESKRQKQIAKLLQIELSAIFMKQGLNIIHNGIISVAHVRITPDLHEARVYISMFQIPNPEQMLTHIKAHDWEIRKELAARIKNQVRKIPVLTYFMDDTIDHVFKIEELFKNLK